MKATWKIIFLTLAIAQLILVLYISIPAIPHNINHTKDGTMYTAGKLSFDLTSDKYVRDENVDKSAEEQGLPSDRIITFSNEAGDYIISILDNSNNLLERDLFDVEVSLLKNPFRHRQIEKTMSEEIPQESERMQKANLYYTYYDLILYEDSTKIFVLQKAEDSDNQISYTLDFKIEGYYYTLIHHNQTLENQIALQNIMEFMRTVHIQ
ncbi:MAG: hypothetical protein PHE21_01450 [Candidatus Dojkabacteria bacterium]|nr:hypothetical protein [Candidatus Dojkabacteria bacterium]